LAPRKRRGRINLDYWRRNTGIHTRTNRHKTTGARQRRVGFGAVVRAVHWRKPDDASAPAARNGILEILALRISAPSGVLGAGRLKGRAY